MRGRGRVGCPAAFERQLAPQLGVYGTPPVEVYAQSYAAIALALGEPQRLYRGELLVFEVGQIQVLEHYLD